MKLCNASPSILDMQCDDSELCDLVGEVDDGIDRPLAFQLP
jgi:hypothetical protein